MAKPKSAIKTKTWKARLMGLVKVDESRDIMPLAAFPLSLT